MKIIAIDPDTKSINYAVYGNEQYIRHGKISREIDIKKYDFEMRNLLKGAGLVAIEDQYLGKNVVTFKKLIKVVGEVEYIAKLLGIKIKPVTPQAWQTKMLRISNKAKRPERKKKALIIAGAIAKETITDHNFADAICIGSYISRRRF